MLGFVYLSDNVQQQLVEFRKKNLSEYEKLLHTDTPVNNLSPILLIKLLTYRGIAKRVERFEIGDLIISGKAISTGLFMPFNASRGDVIDYSGKKHVYYILTQ